MNKKDIFTTFRYKGKTFMLTENEFDFLPGFRTKIKGVELVSINKNLSKRKRQLELHRLITGRGLKIVNFKKNILR